MNTQPEDAEVSVLDLLLVVAENLRLLLLGPLVAGLLALGVAFLLPQSFVSQAILALPTTTTTKPATATQDAQQAAAMMVSPLVLDPIIEAFKLNDGLSVQRARAALEKKIKTTVGKDGLLRLDVTADSPEQAQILANKVIDGWLASTVPRERERQDLEKRLMAAEHGYKLTTQLLERLSAGGASSLARPLTLGDAGTGLVAVGELQARYFDDVLTIPRTLQGLGRDVVKQPPTLPTESIAPKKAIIAISAALSIGFLLLVLTFMRNAWSKASLDPEMAQKKHLLSVALGRLAWWRLR